MKKCANIFPYMRRPLVIYDFATAPFSIYEENFLIAANVGHSPTTGTFDVANSGNAINPGKNGPLGAPM